MSNATTVRMASPATGVGHTYSLLWETQQHRCCGQTWGVWDADHAPSLWFPDSYTLTVASNSQCGVCGSIFTPDVEVVA